MIAAIFSNLFRWAIGLMFASSAAQPAMYVNDWKDISRNAGIDISRFEWFIDQVLALQQDPSLLASLVAPTCIEMVLFGIFGAIWALIGANLFHKDQLA